SDRLPATIRGTLTALLGVLQLTLSSGAQGDGHALAHVVDSCWRRHRGCGRAPWCGQRGHGCGTLNRQLAAITRREQRSSLRAPVTGGVCDKRSALSGHLLPPRIACEPDRLSDARL